MILLQILKRLSRIPLKFAKEKLKEKFSQTAEQNQHAARRHKIQTIVSRKSERETKMARLRAEL